MKNPEPYQKVRDFFIYHFEIKKNASDESPAFKKFYHTNSTLSAKRLQKKLVS